MALHDRGRDSNGTHVVRGWGGEASRQGYPFDPPKKSLHLNLQAVGLSEVLLEGANHVYNLHGNADLTDPTSISVYVNGMALDEKDYELNINKATIKVKRSIQSTDDDLEVRSREDNNFININGVLILEVTPGFIETEDLVHYTPKYGDVLNVNRLAQIEHNQKNSTFVNATRGKKVTAHVLSHQIQKNGIIARIKVKEVQEDNG